MITKKHIAEQLLLYLNHRINLAQLVNWAEEKLLSGGFEEGEEPLIRNVLGQLAAADAEGFGLLWEDCEAIMQILGYQLKIEADKVA